MTIKVDVDSDSTNSLMRDIEKFAVDETNEFIQDLENVIVSKTPVKTGAARAAWDSKEIDRLGDVGEVGNPKDYVKYVNDGTIHISPRKFIEVSIIKVINTRK